MSRATLAADLRDVFPAWMRERGADYHRRGAVTIEAVEPGCIDARVRGTRSYRVRLWWDPDDLDTIWGDCTCPANKRDGACKHFWALVLAVDERGIVPGDDWGSTDSPVAATRSWRDRVRVIGLLGGDSARPAATRETVAHYLLDVEESVVSDAPVVRLLQRTRRKNGEWGALRPLAPTPGNRARVTDPEDRRILALLAPFPIPTGIWRGSRAETQCERLLGGEAALELLPRLAATGRLGWSDPCGAGVLAWDGGPPWELRIDVAHEGDEAIASGRLERVGDGGEERLDLDEPLALFELGLAILPGTAARFDPRGAMQWCAGLRVDGPIRAPRADATGLLAVVLEHAADAIGPAHAGDRSAGDGFDLAGIAIVDAAPRPHVFLERSQERNAGSRLDCRVSFDYRDARVAAGDERRFVPVTSAAEATWVRRDLGREEALLARLAELGMRRAGRQEDDSSAGTLAASRLSAFVRALIGEGWSVEAEGKLHRTASGTSVSVRSGIDWFELDGEVAFGDQRVPFPEVLAAARARRDTVELGDGSFGVLPERWLEQWGLLELAGKASGAAVRVPRAQGWLLDALLAAREEARAEVDAGFAGYRARLARFAGVAPAREPAGFRGELREYQRAGLGWLAFLREMGLGGCLADDMGLGKTVQVLAHLVAIRRPALVVAPLSLVFNWIDEAARFAPELTVLDYTGANRAARLAEAGEVDIVVTTYGTLRRDAPALAERHFDTIVIDEAQAIKNTASQSAKAARLLRADHRIALSGTPIENHLGELWSLLEFLNPGMLGRAKAFRDWVARPASSAVNGSAGELGELSRALRPFFLRRTKGEVLDDLPEKTEQVIVCRLGLTERRRYDELREHYRAALLGKNAQELASGQMHVLEALLRLRQCACHPGLLDGNRRGEGSAKLDALLAQLEELAAEGHKALVFSQFTTLLGIVRERLDAAGIPYAYLDGRTRNRKELVERFQADPACPVFLVSLKAGGHGLNLTAADYVFLLDPWWNPAVESQAIDRAHRIGRMRPVIAYRLIAADTVEERIQELQSDKRALAEAIFAGAGTGGAITRAELERLLA